MGQPVNTYPKVLGEFATLQQVTAGRSISRFGDGEIRQADRVCDIKPQSGDAKLTARLRAILQDSGNCLVGIPNIHDPGPKAQHWNTYQVYAKLLADRPYASAFITRPDSAPWINTQEYWDLLQSLWLDREVTLVRGAQKSFTADVLYAAGAKSVREIIGPPQHAWAIYDQLLNEIGTPERALLCLGPTATVMAVDLCAKGVHAIDLGHAGMFWKKHITGRPMWVTPEDKVAK
jgi:hypothetical protein